MKRKIIKIDHELCNGCGLCLPGCPEGALQLIDGKARLVSDLFCDGLGACIGECPQGAIAIEERDALPYDEERVMEGIVPQGPATIRAHLDHLREHDEQEYLARALGFLKKREIEIPSGFGREEAVSASPGQAAPLPGPGCGGGGCPGTRVVDLTAEATGPATAGPAPSRLRQWPVQLNLVPPAAPFLEGADLLVTADCLPIAYGDFHEDLLKGRAVVCGCPKFDDGEAYRERLAEYFRQHRIKSLTVARMEVPCCSGLTALARKALADSGREFPLKEVVISIRGEKLG